MHKDSPIYSPLGIPSRFKSPGYRFSYRKLTTQINIDGDKYLHDDFAFGTRDDLIPQVQRVTEAAEIHKAGLNKPFARIRFDFVIVEEAAGAPSSIVEREHAAAA